MATIQAAQNQKQTKTGGSKIVAKVMLIVIVDIQDRLINSQTGNIGHEEFAQKYCSINIWYVFW